MNWCPVHGSNVRGIRRLCGRSAACPCSYVNLRPLSQRDENCDYAEQLRHSSGRELPACLVIGYELLLLMTSISNYV